MTDKEIIYLDLDDVVRLHTRIFQIECTTGRDRLRDHAALESALARPANYAVYRGADLASQAAVLAHGLAQSQSFIDGNKRTAVIAMVVFLSLNGWDVSLADTRLAELILAFARGIEPDALADELRPSLTPRQ